MLLLKSYQVLNPYPELWRKREYTTCQWIVIRLWAMQCNFWVYNEDGEEMEFESFLTVQCISLLRVWLKMSQITQLQWISKQVLSSCSKQIMEVRCYCPSTNILSSNIIHSLNGLHSVSAFAAWLLWSYTPIDHPQLDGSLCFSTHDLAGSPYTYTQFLLPLTCY